MTAAGIRGSSIMCADLPAYLALPAPPRQSSAAPCVIVMHERYGFVRHTADLACRFAADGYVALAPDFYHRHPDPAALHRGDASYAMSDAEALAGLEAAIETLGSIAEAAPARIAVMGVCQTGRHPLLLAASRRIGAALVWYGAAQPREWAVSADYARPLEDIVAALDCPVLGMFGEADHLISVADVRRLRDCLERHGKSYSLHIWPDAPHGFLNDTMPGRYRPVQANAAWAEQRAFLAAALAPDRDRSRRSARFAADVAADYDFSRNLRMA